jgi:hypothetical protein
LRDGDHFCMGRRILEPFSLIMRPPDHALAEGHYYRANRHLILGRRCFCFLQCHFHMGNVERMPRIRHQHIGGQFIQRIAPLNSQLTRGRCRTY